MDNVILDYEKYRFKVYFDSKRIGLIDENDKEVATMDIDDNKLESIISLDCPRITEIFNDFIRKYNLN
jgi:hypothetical protein